MTLAEILKRLSAMPPEDQANWVAKAQEANKGFLWKPNPGPQTEAYFSKADELFYGGAAGGGKSDLGIGLALTSHRRSLLLRRTNHEANGLVERMTEIIGNREGWSGQQGLWKLQDRAIEIGGCQLEEDKQKRKGSAKDLYFFDELPDFTESQYAFITGWNRSAVVGQRCRIVAAGNPPTDPQGFWILRRWGAWLDPQHQNPAQPGELRWYTTGEDGKEIEVDGPGPHKVSGQEVYATSRTFIPSKLADNPDQDTQAYRARLAALPLLERAAYRDGLFGAALQDDAKQCIPTAWVQAAQGRWTAQAPVGVPMCAIGVDVSLPGGRDATVLSARHDGWFAPLIRLEGKDVPDSKQLAGRVVAMRRDNAKVVIDLGGGWGGETLAQLRTNGIDTVGHMGIKEYSGRTADNQLRLSNTRTAVYWRLREALDPSQPGGSRISLPPSSALLADLCAPRYDLRTTGLYLESKKELVKRLGRSPDEGDAVAMAWFYGVKQSNFKGGWKEGYQETLATEQLTKRSLKQRTRRK